MNATQLFDSKFATTTKEIPFSEEWNNGTGYLDFAVKGEHAVVLENGEIAKSVTSENKTNPRLSHRRMIFVGTALGPVVVFERYNDHSFLVCNAAPELRSVCLFETSGKMQDHTAELLLGDPDYLLCANVGDVIDRVIRAAAFHIVPKAN